MWIRDGRWGRQAARRVLRLFWFRRVKRPARRARPARTAVVPARGRTSVPRLRRTRDNCVATVPRRLPRRPRHHSPQASSSAPPQPRTPNALHPPPTRPTATFSRRSQARPRLFAKGSRRPGQTRLRPRFVATRRPQRPCAGYLAAPRGTTPPHGERHRGPLFVASGPSDRTLFAPLDSATVPLQGFRLGKTRADAGAPGTAPAAVTFVPATRAHQAGGYTPRARPRSGPAVTFHRATPRRRTPRPPLHL